MGLGIEALALARRSEQKGSTRSGVSIKNRPLVLPLVGHVAKLYDSRRK